MKISISGDIGSGKSTVGRILSQELEYDFISTGAIQRDIAKKMGMTTLELNKFSDNNFSIDDEIDKHTIAIENKNLDIVVDSRLAWNFIPSSFKVYLTCSLNVAAKRIFHDKNRIQEEQNTSENQLLRNIILRRKSERDRFKSYYKVDFMDLRNYDIVINTSNMSPQIVAKLIKIAANEVIG